MIDNSHDHFYPMDMKCNISVSYPQPECIYCFFRERFIPITRRSIVRHLIEEKDFLSEDEKKKYEDFALALDSAIVNKYHGILQELKVRR